MGALFCSQIMIVETQQDVPLAGDPNFFEFQLE
jgi:hypothetical protein